MKFAKVCSCAAAVMLLATCGCTKQGGALSVPSFASGTTNFTTVEVIRGDISEVLTGNFYYRSLDTTTCRFMVSGTLATKPVIYDKEYKKGDVLATLAEKDDYALEISRKNQEINELNIELKTASEAKDGGGEVQLLKLKYQQELNKYDSMKAGGSAADELERQKYAADQAGLSYTDALETADRDYRSLTSELEVKSAELAQLQNYYDACTLRAPMDGACIGISTAEIGAHINAYSGFVTMADPKQICIAYDGSINTSNYLALGDFATLTVEGVGYSVQVVQVPETTPSDVDYSVDSTVRLYFFRVADYDYTGKELGNAVTTETIRLTVNEHKDVLLIPATLLGGDATDGYTVNLLVGDTPITKPVTVGLVNGEYAEITAGLKDGDLVVSYT